MIALTIIVICLLIIVIALSRSINDLKNDLDLLNIKLLDITKKTNLELFKLSSDFYTHLKEYENHKHKYEFKDEILYIQEPIEQE